MRVTNNMMILNMMQNLNTNLERMSNYQDQLATGKRISSPMEDPVGIAKVLKYKTDISELDQFQKNTRDALAWLETTESAMMDLGNTYQRLGELATQAANGTYSAGDTQKIKSEVEQLKSHIVNLANTSFAGRYVFSSYQTDEKLMNTDGTYNIDITSFDISERQKTVYQVGIGEEIEVSTNGLDLFGYESITNFMTTSMPDGDNEGLAATAEFLIADIDFETSYPSTPSTIGVGINVGGVTFRLDANALNGSPLYPLTSERIIEAVLEAENVSSPGDTLGELGDVDVYFNGEGKLVISAKDEGAASILAAGDPPFDGTPTASTSHTPATVTASSNVSNGDIAAATGTQSFIVTLNGKSEKIEIDMSTVANDTALDAAIQAKLDAVFPSPPSTIGIDVTVSDGSAITFTTVDPAGTTSTNKHLLDVRPIQSVESTVMKDLDDFIAALDTGDSALINPFVDKFDEHQDSLLEERSNIGARVNRMELVLNRIAENSVNFTRLLSDAEDADMSEVIMHLKNSENVYRASLQTGAKVIQPSLIDFLR